MYGNGKGELVDESGNEHFEMDIDTEAYLIEVGLYRKHGEQQFFFYENAIDSRAGRK